MYPKTGHIFLSTMMPDDLDLFLAKENKGEDHVTTKPHLHHHFHESSLPNCSHSMATSDLNRSWFSQRKSSQRENKKEESGTCYEAAGPLLLLLSKESCEPNLVEENEEEEEEEGFRTPTCLHQRIPAAVEQCPPAPRKPKPHLKRKAPHTHTCAALSFSSKQLQLLFPLQHNPLSDSHIITKKVRRDDSNQ